MIILPFSSRFTIWSSLLFLYVSVSKYSTEKYRLLLKNVFEIIFGFINNKESMISVLTLDVAVAVNATIGNF